jgi:hypothetical protein
MRACVRVQCAVQGLKSKVQSPTFKRHWTFDFGPWTGSLERAVRREPLTDSSQQERTEQEHALVQSFNFLRNLHPRGGSWLPARSIAAQRSARLAKGNSKSGRALTRFAFEKCWYLTEF